MEKFNQPAFFFDRGKKKISGGEIKKYPKPVVLKHSPANTNKSKTDYGSYNTLCFSDIFHIVIDKMNKYDKVVNI